MQWGTVLSSVIASSAFAAVITSVMNSRSASNLEEYKASEAKRLEVAKIELQQQSALVTSQITLYGTLGDETARLRDALDEYVALVQIAMGRCGNKAIAADAVLARRKVLDASGRVHQLSTRPRVSEGIRKGSRRNPRQNQHQLVPK